MAALSEVMDEILENVNAIKSLLKMILTMIMRQTLRVKISLQSDLMRVDLESVVLTELLRSKRFDERMKS